MNLMSKPPLGLKQPRAVKDPEYIKRVRGERCIICDSFGEAQNSPTQAHHCIHGRFGTLRTSDRCAIPLCEGHHQGNFDTSKIALHRDPDMWKEAYGRDFDYIAVIQDRMGV